MPYSVEGASDVNEDPYCEFSFVHANTDLIYYADQLRLRVVARSESELVVWEKVIGVYVREETVKKNLFKKFSQVGEEAEGAVIARQSGIFAWFRDHGDNGFFPCGWEVGSGQDGVEK